MEAAEEKQKIRQEILAKGKAVTTSDVFRVFWFCLAPWIFICALLEEEGYSKLMEGWICSFPKLRSKIKEE